MKKYFKRLKFGIRIILGDKPTIFFLLYGLRKHNRDLFITNETELVVNAYPRCGNTFFFYSLKNINPELNIAHHLHIPALTMKAVEKGIPNIVIVREPMDAIVSLLIREDHITIKQAIRFYIGFHKKILELKDSVLILDFKIIINQFPSAIEKINCKFGMRLNNYRTFEDKEKESIFVAIDAIDKNFNGRVSERRVSRPVVSGDKLEQKEKIKRRLNDDFAYEINICEIVYKELILN